MNDIKSAPNYSVEIISQLRAQKKQELRESKERIQLLTQDLFSPQKSKNKMENMMQHINAGIAALWTIGKPKIHAGYIPVLP